MSITVFITNTRYKYLVGVGYRRKIYVHDNFHT